MAKSFSEPIRPDDQTGFTTPTSIRMFAGGTRGQRAVQVKPLEDSGIPICSSTEAHSFASDAVLPGLRTLTAAESSRSKEPTPHVISRPYHDVLVRVPLPAVVRKGRSGSALDVRSSFFPGAVGDEEAQLAASQISTSKVDAAVAAGHSRLVRGLRERFPFEKDRSTWGKARLDFRAALCQHHGVAKAVTSGPEREDASGGGAVGAVSRNVFREGRGRRTSQLVRSPLRAVHLHGTFAWTAPGANLLAAE